MGIGQLESTRVISYLIVWISAITLARSDAPTTIIYTCGRTGVVSVQLPDFTHYAIISGADGSRQYCKPKDASFERACGSAKEKTPLVLLYEDSTKENIIGGKMLHYYRLACTDGVNNVTHNTTVFKAISELTNPTVETHVIKHDFDIQLWIGNKQVTPQTPVHIGDLLKLQLTGTEVKIQPTSCSAYHKDNKIKEGVELWAMENNVCKNKESSIMETAMWSQTTENTPNIEINMYAFRFATDAEVVISCTAFVCSSTNTHDCAQTCVNKATPQSQTGTGESGRKRRAIVGKENTRSIHTSSVSFAVAENKALNNSSPGLSSGFLQFVTIGLVLKFVFSQMQ